MSNQKNRFQQDILNRVARWLAALLCFSCVSHAQTTRANITEEQYRSILRLMKAASYEQVIEECKALLEQDARFARGYARLADAAQALNQLEPVRDYFIALRQQSPDSLRALYGLTILYRRLKEPNLAIETAKQCIKIAPDFVSSYLVLADTYLSAGKPAEAVTYFMSLPDSPIGAAAVSYALGYLFYAQQRWPEALNAFDKALAADPHLLDAHQYKALVLYYSNRYPEALAAYQTLYLAAQTSGDVERQARAQANIGPLQRLLGEYAAAKETLLAGLRAANQMEDRALQLMCLSNLSSIFQQQDAYGEALSYGKRWLALSQMMKDDKSAARALGHLAISYRAIGDLEQAVSASEQSLLLAGAIKDEYNLASVLADFADLQLEQKQPARAQTLLTESLSLARKLNSLALERDALAVQARLFAMTGNEQAAWETQQQALQLARTMQTPLREGESLNYLGGLKLKAQDWLAARQFFEQSLALGEKLAALNLIWQAHTGLALVAIGQGQLEKARNHYQSAIEAIERTRGGLRGEDEKAGFFQDKTEVYRKQITLLWRMSTGSSSSANAAQAFHYAERGRARALLDSLRETYFHLEQSLPEAVRQEQAQWLTRFAKTETELRTVTASANPDRERLSTLKQNLQELSEALQAWQLRLRQQDPNYATFRYPEPLSVQQVQQLLKQK